MKKIVTMFIVLLMLISSSVVAFASSVSSDVVEKNVIETANKVVVVGCNVKDKEEIFGNKSDEEIYKILQDISRDLYKMDNTKNIESAYLNSKLLVSVKDKEKGIYFSNVDMNISNVNELNKINDVEIKGIGVADAFLYSIILETQVGAVEGVYCSGVYGMYEEFSETWYIYDVNTSYISGGVFNVNDQFQYDNEAATVFSHIDGSYWSTAIVFYHITDNGIIVFTGMSPD